jgi:hypothetical protein
LSCQVQRIICNPELPRSAERAMTRVKPGRRICNPELPRSAERAMTRVKPGRRCAKALINAYLIDLTLPDAGTVCR